MIAKHASALLMAAAFPYLLSVAQVQRPALRNEKLVASPDGPLHQLEFTPDGARVVYLGANSLGKEQLFSVPLDGSADPVLLTDPLHEHYDVYAHDLAPDGSRVVYRAYFDPIAGLPTSYVASVPVDGSEEPVDLGFLYWFRVSPDSTSVIANVVGTGDSEELARAPIDGSSPPVLVTTPPSAPASRIKECVISPDSSRIVFVQDRETPGVFELYCVPMEGGTPTKLSPPLVSGGDVCPGNVFEPRFSPDSSRVIYVADQEVDERMELYSVPLDGGPAVKLNGPLVAGGDVALSGQRRLAQVTADGTRVVYVADQLVDGVFELFSVPITGGASIRLNDPLVAGGRISEENSGAEPFWLTPGGQVLYRADQEVDERFELYSVACTGGPVTKLNGPLTAGGDVARIVRPSADGRRVVFAADQEVDQRFEIYSTLLDGNGAATKLNGPLPPGGSVQMVFSWPNFGLQNDSVFYVADQEVDEVFELFQVSIRGGPRTKATPALVPGGDVSLIAPRDGRTVVYLADQDIDGVVEMYASTLRSRAEKP